MGELRLAVAVFLRAVQPHGKVTHRTACFEDLLQKKSNRSVGRKDFRHAEAHQLHAALAQKFFQGAGGDNQIAVAAEHQHRLFELIEQALEITQLLAQQVHLGNHHAELVRLRLRTRSLRRRFILAARQGVQHPGHIAQRLESEVGEDQRNQNGCDDRERGNHRRLLQLRQDVAADQRRKDHHADEQVRALSFRP